MRRALETRTFNSRRTMSDLEETLRRLTIHDDAFIEEAFGETPSAASNAVDPKTLALARIAALIAIGGPLGSFLSRVDAALIEGATSEEILGVLTGVAHDIGEARAVAAAPAIGAALGLDVPPPEHHSPSRAASMS
jgi:alkylhydroperoxidase/carboxymuconolactone decarboxylase family protein YurZ